LISALNEKLPELQVVIYNYQPTRWHSIFDSNHFYLTRKTQ
jgi:hypothetical protein